MSRVFVPNLKDTVHKVHMNISSGTSTHSASGPHKEVPVGLNLKRQRPIYWHEQNIYL